MIKYIRLGYNEELPGIKIIPITRYADDRGSFANLALAEYPKIKRSYLISNHKSGIIRAFHGHRKEQKLFYALKGAFKFIIMEMDKSSSKWKEYVLSADKPQLLIVPNNYYNGFVSLTDDNLIICYSSSTMEESRSDDFRLAYDILGEVVWKIKHR